MKCPRCDVEMLPGVALENSEQADVLYWRTPISNGKLVEILKCPKCGLSEMKGNYE
jgi:hypothetical protein